MSTRTRRLLAGCILLVALAAAGLTLAARLDGGRSAHTAPAARVASTAVGRAAAPPPPIVSWAIPFPVSRRRETARYAQRHYGLDTWRIRGPHVIVEHFTASESLQSTRATFAADTPDPELGELPGVCSHFVIGKDGTIYQLVPVTVICRHTVGLNWTAIGIEHVGLSDGEVLRDRAQIAASLQLTLWLMQRYGVRLRDVIGHNESLLSPYRRELYRPWRCQTHGDWTHTDMLEYRRRLLALARRDGLRTLPKAETAGPAGRTPGC